MEKFRARTCGAAAAAAVAAAVAAAPPMQSQERLLHVNLAAEDDVCVCVRALTSMRPPTIVLLFHLLDDLVICSGCGDTHGAASVSRIGSGGR